MGTTNTAEDIFAGMDVYGDVVPDPTTGRLALQGVAAILSGALVVAGLFSLLAWGFVS